MQQAFGITLRVYITLQECKELNTTVVVLIGSSAHVDCFDFMMRWRGWIDGWGWRSLRANGAITKCHRSGRLVKRTGAAHNAEVLT